VTISAVNRPISRQPKRSESLAANSGKVGGYDGLLSSTAKEEASFSKASEVDSDLPTVCLFFAPVLTLKRRLPNLDLKLF